MVRAVSRPHPDNDDLPGPSTSDESLSSADAADVAAIFAALGDPVRLRLFSLISATGEICSCNLEAPLQRSQPTISHHTKILAEAGLIRGEKRGRWVWWSIEPSRVAALQEILTQTSVGATRH